LAVFADFLNAAAVGAPLLPTLRIRSGVLPAAFCAFMRARFLVMLRYNPGRFIATPSAGYGHPYGQQAFSLQQILLVSFSSLAFSYIRASFYLPTLRIAILCASVNVLPLRIAARIDVMCFAL
jgi:hypothetical protein